MTIPRFNAQIQSLQVPSMKDYQAEQNASIAQSLANFSRQMLGVADKIYSNQEKQKQQNLEAAMQRLRLVYQSKNATPEEIKAAEDNYIAAGGTLGRYNGQAK